MAANTTRDTRDARTETAEAQAYVAAQEAIGAVLVRIFPEATHGDERPETAYGLDIAIRRAVRAWVEDNVPAFVTTSSGDIVRCAICGSSVVYGGDNSERRCAKPSATFPAHEPAPAFYPDRITVRDLLKMLEAEPNKDVPVVIATDDWYYYVGAHHAGPRDGMDENDGYALPTISAGAEYDTRDL